MADDSPAADALAFLVGRDDHDHWIAVETHGRAGGIFADEASALRYAREECRGRAGAVRSIGHIRGDFLTQTAAPPASALQR